MTRSALWLLALALLPHITRAQAIAPLTVDVRQAVYQSNGPSTYLDWKPMATRALPQLPGYHPKTIPLSRYGGRRDHRVNATGFYTVRKIDGRWWSVDPDGYLFLHVGVNAVAPGASSHQQEELAKHFGTQQQWAAAAHTLLLDHGFTGTGAWSDIKLLSDPAQQKAHPLAYTINLDLMAAYGRSRHGTHTALGHAGYPHDVIFTFDPGFAEFVEKRATELEIYRNDPNLFGYFTDNELPFGRLNLDNYLKLPPDEPGYIAAKKWMDEHHATGTTDDLRKQFLAYEADTYFSIVTAVIRRHDPHHMILGCRFYGPARFYEELIRSAGRYLDVVSFNYYNRWTPDPAEMANWVDWSGRPFLASEFYVKGEDSGLGNQSGAGWIVHTQRDRGLFYQNFALGLLQSGGCIGWHWFKYQDNDPTQVNAEPSNVDGNKGIVDRNYAPYIPLLDAMSALNRNRYALADYFSKP
jgi:hypothetical protein